MKDINSKLFNLFKENHLLNGKQEKIHEEENSKTLRNETYHISRSHFMAMFDLVNFVFSRNYIPISTEETPLGNLLKLKINNSSLENIRTLNKLPLVYYKEELINILEDTSAFSLAECLEIYKNIDWKKYNQIYQNLGI